MTNDGGRERLEQGNQLADQLELVLYSAGAGGMNAHSTAIHEAGHAVMNLRLGGSLAVVSIIPRPDHGTVGHTVGDDDDWPVDVAHTKKRVLSFLGGWAAVRAAGIGRAADGCAGDFVGASKLLADWKLGSLKRWKRRALTIMRQPANRRAVTLVAERLRTDPWLDGQLVPVMVRCADGEITPERLAAFEAMMTAANISRGRPPAAA